MTQTQNRSGWLISDFPNELQGVLPLGTGALDGRYFTPQMIYFWESSQRHSYLVPDLRYVPIVGLTEGAQQVIDAALQLFGGEGVRSGQVVESLYREIRALRIYEGATEVQQLIIARELLKGSAS